MDKRARETSRQRPGVVHELRGERSHDDRARERRQIDRAARTTKRVVGEQRAGVEETRRS